MDGGREKRRIEEVCVGGGRAFSGKHTPGTVRSKHLKHAHARSRNPIIHREMLLSTSSNPI